GTAQNTILRKPGTAALVRSQETCFPNACDSRPLFSLLVFLLPLPVDIPFLLLASEFRRAFPLELVPVNRQLVLDGDLVVHKLPFGGERERIVLQLQILEARLLLVRPAHRPGEFVAVLLDRQGGRP